MVEIKKSIFNILVGKLMKGKKKLLTCDEIKSLCSSIMDDQYNDTKVYKLIYQLKNKSYLIPLKKDIFYFKNPEDKITEQEIVDKYYRWILKDHCQQDLALDWYVGGIKSLELHFSNYDIPEEISILNKKKQSIEIALLGKKIIFKKYVAKNNDFFALLKKYRKKIKIGKFSFFIAPLEISLLETLYSPVDHQRQYVEVLVKNILKKKNIHLQMDIFSKILQLGKHHSSFNRLYKIAKIVNPTLAESFKLFIKRYSFTTTENILSLL